MKPGWQRLKEIFFRAIDLDTQERRVFLDEACVEDPDLRGEVEALLAADRSSKAWFWQPAARAVPELVAGDPETSLVGRRVGVHRVVAELGRGGMGTVYLAERADGQYEERVALKVVRGNFGRAALAARFRRERQILARLRHPFIARLQDGGMLDDGRPYLVMEWVEGEPIDRYCDRRGAVVGERLELLRKVCEAVSAAHRNLVVHCDLKPANILVTPEGLPKVLDFGIARLLDGAQPFVDGSDAGEPGSGAVDGRESTTPAEWLTPDYTSPEQARGGAITTASDVYSLGVVLHELLTGELPARSSGQPSQDRLGSDLGAIVRKALDRDPEQRYSTGAELADDLHRHLEDLPVRARPQTVGYRASRFVRRHKLAMAAVGLLAVSLVTGLAATLWQARKAEARARQAELMSSFLVDLFEASDVENPAGRGRSLLARELLDRAPLEIHQLDDAPTIQAEVMTTIGKAYRSQALFEEAQDWFSKALATGGGELRARVRSELGLLRYQQGRYREASQLLREALRDQRLLDASPAAIADTLNHLGLVERRLDNLRAAEEAHREALALRLRTLDRDHLDVTYSHTNLGVLDKGRCRRDDEAACQRAVAHLEEALRLRRRALPADHPLIANSLDQLASAWLAWKRDPEILAKAETLRRQALAVRERSLAHGHPDVALSLANLAYVLARKTHFEEAESLYRRALTLFLEHFDETHENVLAAHLGLAFVLYSQGQCGNAEERYRLALTLAQRAADARSEEEIRRNLEAVLSRCESASGIDS